ncbi:MULTISPECIES: LysE family translocator [unclassified Duganella]|uniref:LysE family translocator n=1 Tax=unclassified Duganella TaxID=2636909 RepID=UPI000E347FDE|nr:MULTISPECIES: LysE family translocator [unclassified Duganella]RFP09974.1 LysE family translocator [Duganella sp. BJB475]RFP25721.1 LysE family translocator [Duganella sp. BJB476]
MSILISMAAFALASSITPGPVNIVALSSGAQHGFRASMRHVTGATVGFTALLLLTGLGLHELLIQLPALTRAIQLAGVAFLLFMAWKLARDDGALSSGDAAKGPSLAAGAAMQWLNPKAWVASVAGMGAFAADGDAVLVWQFAALYFVICYLSIACWAYAGTFLRRRLSDPAVMRWFNRAMALLLAASAAYLLLSASTVPASPPATA